MINKIIIAVMCGIICNSVYGLVDESQGTQSEASESMLNPNDNSASIGEPKTNTPFCMVTRDKLNMIEGILPELKNQILAFAYPDMFPLPFVIGANTAGITRSIYPNGKSPLVWLPKNMIENYKKNSAHLPNKIPITQLRILPILQALTKQVLHDKLPDQFYDDKSVFMRKVLDDGKLSDLGYYRMSWTILLDKEPCIELGFVPASPYDTDILAPKFTVWSNSGDKDAGIKLNDKAPLKFDINLEFGYYFA